MKILQKSILRGIIAILSIDIFFQLTNHKALSILIDSQINNDSIAYWCYPLAFIIGSLLAGYLLESYSHFSIISLGIFLIGLIHGGYSLISTIESFLFLRFSHGFLVGSSLTVVLSWYSHLMGRENPRRQMGRLLLPIPIFALLFSNLQLSSFSLVEENISLFAFVFSFVFISVLSFILLGYLKDIPEGFRRETSKKQSPNMTLSSFIYYSLTVMIGAFTFGTLLQSPFDLKLMGLVSLFLSMALAFVTGLGSVGDQIGDTKGVLMALMMMTLSLSTIPLLHGSYLVLIPLVVLGMAMGILGCCVYGGLQDGFSPRTKGLSLGVLHSLLILSFIGGWRTATVTYPQPYSPLFVNCLVIIGISLLFIRKIHRSLETTTGVRSIR